MVLFPWPESKPLLPPCRSSLRMPLKECGHIVDLWSQTYWDCHGPFCCQTRWHWTWSRCPLHLLSLSWLVRWRLALVQRPYRHIDGGSADHCRGRRNPALQWPAKEPKDMLMSKDACGAAWFGFTTSHLCILFRLMKRQYQRSQVRDGER